MRSASRVDAVGLNLEPRTIESWMKFIRYHPDQADRYMDCFWFSQIDSKARLLVELEQIQPKTSSVYIFGGWYGVMAQMILDSLDFFPDNIYTIDIDPQCEWVVNDVITDGRVCAVTADCATYRYPIVPDVVINTVTEHLQQSDYDLWWSNVPRGTRFFLQGNDYYDNIEHIRCFDSLEDFETHNCSDAVMVGRSRWEFTGPNDKQYNRFMVWGVKR